MKWSSFFFEGNMWFGYVDSPDKWVELLETYAEQRMSFSDLMEARECARNEFHPTLPPKFGFAIECDGKRTLGDFFEENGMPGMLFVQAEIQDKIQDKRYQ